MPANAADPEAALEAVQHADKELVKRHFWDAARLWASDAVDSGEPMGKAGAYAVQGAAAAYIRSIHGSYTGIMGLQLHEAAQLLKDAGVRW